jgi:hypothetical protein
VSTGIAATARRLGQLRYFERRGFEVLGAWASTPAAASVPAAAVLAAGQASHHAERAERLGAVLPVTPGFGPTEVTVPASSAVAAFAALLAGTPAVDGGRPDPASAGAGRGSGADGPVGGVPGPATTGLDAVTFLAGHQRVLLARLAVAYDALAATLDARVAAPVVRALRHVAHDLEADRREGEAVLQWLLVDAAAVDRAAARVAELERALAVAGGLHADAR